jgi:hypothetical protein
MMLTACCYTCQRWDLDIETKSPYCARPGLPMSRYWSCFACCDECQPVPGFRSDPVSVYLRGLERAIEDNPLPWSVYYRSLMSDPEKALEMDRQYLSLVA